MSKERSKKEAVKKIKKSLLMFNKKESERRVLLMCVIQERAKL